MAEIKTKIMTKYKFDGSIQTYAKKVDKSYRVPTKPTGFAYLRDLNGKEFNKYLRQLTKELRRVFAAND